jgi:hypothetical protein
MPANALSNVAEAQRNALLKIGTILASLDYEGLTCDPPCPESVPP